MANYFSGEEIKVGDFITTDNGHDKNKVIKLIFNAILWFRLFWRTII
jgi:hypothetical protein